VVFAQVIGSLGFHMCMTCFTVFVFLSVEVCFDEYLKLLMTRNRI